MMWLLAEANEDGKIYSDNKYARPFQFLLVGKTYICMEIK